MCAMKKRASIAISILFFAIGFATVSTTLVINGSAKIGENVDDFSVIFTAASLDGADVYASVIDDTKKIINFSTNDLKTLNQTSILAYKVTNNSSNYDAEVSVNCKVKDDITAKYTSIKNELENNATIVKAKESVNGTLTITLEKTATEEVREEYVCELTFNAVERDILGIKGDYTELLLNGTDPVLTDELVPITISGEGTIAYANLKEEWYSYEKKNWANAVILRDGVNYKKGDIINEDDIESYFVWIPRFRYKLFNVDDVSLTTLSRLSDVTSNPSEIEIEFETKNERVSNGSKNGEWLTHPAFTTFDVNGLWVGKFETGYKGATSVSAAQVNSTNASKVIVKPNVYGWRNINVGNIFKTSYNYHRELDSHMMKNTEWGAVAYLSHSKYGINKEININNNSNYKTGYSALPSTNQQTYPGVSGDGDNYNQPYNTEVGYLASTTGNISGIYDMSGGAGEYLASYISGNVGSSGLAPSNYDIKYFDVYSNTSTNVAYQNRILGDATGEMGPFYRYTLDNVKVASTSWYQDRSLFVESALPWFGRGGGTNYGAIAGIFNFDRGTGENHNFVGFRIVLAP